MFLWLPEAHLSTSASFPVPSIVAIQCWRWWWCFVSFIVCSWAWAFAWFTLKVSTKCTRLHKSKLLIQDVHKCTVYRLLSWYFLRSRVERQEQEQDDSFEMTNHTQYTSCVILMIDRCCFDCGRNERCCCWSGHLYWMGWSWYCRERSSQNQNFL